MDFKEMKKTIVFYYHSISQRIKNDWSRKYLTLEVNAFEALLKYLINNKYKVISLEEAHANNWNFKEKTACLTFDDGFADFYIYVYPLLKKYKMPGTVFVSTEFVEDYRKETLPTLQDYWAGNKNMKELDYWGYLNWEEMRLMEKSGWVKVESHTATHMKYSSGPILKDVHHPGSNCLYPVGLLYPELKTKYIRESEAFERKLSYGYPFFEEKSAVLTPIHFPNSDLIKEVIEIFKDYNWANYEKTKAVALAENIVKQYRQNDNVFEKIESKEEMEKRLHYEIVESKNILEKNLERPISFLCWPHGDNDKKSHDMAIKAGFLATSLGSKVQTNDFSDRIPPRFQNKLINNSIRLGLFKMDMKIKEYQGAPFAKFISKVYKLKGK
ncbi:MAG: hypothetical protein COA32_13060 [Fluviicola sp.]|nr:MAG: hypothetical protein COA32_13060 [Fluviicola sp.]